MVETNGKKMADTYFFYVPFLHRASLAANIPDMVHCIPPGHMAAAPASEAQKAVLATMPLAPAQARAVLEELMQLGAAGLFSAGASAQQEVPALAADEKAALASLCGDTPNTPAPPVDQKAESIVKERIACQKQLMLAYMLEECSLEATRHINAYSQAEASFTRSIGKEGSGYAATNSAPPPSIAPAPWQQVVDAVLPFLPQGAILFTDCTRMIADLQRIVPFGPVPEHSARLCNAIPHTGSVSCCMAHGWQLTGRKGPVATRPWLDHLYTVLAASAL